VQAAHTLQQTFAALGDPTRFAIVERLLNEGEMSAGQLVEGVNISGPAVSKHLKILRETGLVRHRIDRQRRLYTVRGEAVQAIQVWTNSHQDFWESSLNRLAEAIRSETTNG
jgi:DNA-binding transcriptional ArsR family regulator